MVKYTIELTNDCNLKCEMCPRQYTDMEIGYMSNKTWRKIIDMIPFGSTVLPFWRGESTLHPMFNDMMEDLNNYKVVIATNGTNPDLIIKSLPYLSVINVSIHGGRSYDGYLKIKSSATNGTLVISSKVDSEKEYVSTDRVYRRHTTDGLWGKVDGVVHKERILCNETKDNLYSWDGEKMICRHVWDKNAIHPCLRCDQWMGNGKTL